MSVIELNSVDLVYPIYSVKAQSIRNSVANLAVGGRLLKDGQDIINVRALHNVSFRLEDGDRLGVVGHNGAGKTTLLKVIAGVYEPTRGLVTVRGRISSMIDIGLGLDWNCTGRENIMTMGRMRAIPTQQIQAKIPEITEFSELGAFLDLPLKTYSSGMAARLVFAVATALEPDILLLDEWMGVSDASFVHKATQRMHEIVSKSRAMVLASHNHDLLRATCNKILVLDGGTIDFFGSISDWDSRLQSLAS